MHPEAFDFVKRTIHKLPMRYSVFEIGSRNINGGVKQLFKAYGSTGLKYTGIDLMEGRDVDIVGDFTEHFGQPEYDTVVCCEVLEHTAWDTAVISNARRLLLPGGWLIITCATNPRVPHSRFDGGPLRAGEYYYNVLPEALLNLLTGWAKTVLMEVHKERGDLYVAAQSR